MFTFASTFEFVGGLQLSMITRIYSALPQILAVPLQCSCAAEIFFTDLTGDGTGGDVLPGTNLGAFGRSVKVGNLNKVIDSFNSTTAAKLISSGHAAVARTESSFDMPDRDQELGTNQGGSHRGVYVSVNKNEVGFVLRNDWLETRDYFGSLLRVASGTDSETYIGVGHFKLSKENRCHISVAMLAGVDQRLTDDERSTQRTYDGRRFHKIGTSANHMKDVQVDCAEVADSTLRITGFLGVLWAGL